MKKLLLLIFSVIGVLVLAIIIASLFFRGEILDHLKSEIENKLNASVHMSDVSISASRHFPDLSIDVTGLEVVRENQDTIADVETIEVVVDVLSLVKGDAYKVNLLNIENGYVYYEEQSDHVSNKTNSPSSANESEKGLKLGEVVVKNMDVSYTDKKTNISYVLEDLNVNLSALLGSDVSNADLALIIGKLGVKQGERILFNDTKIDWTASLKSESDNIELLENKLKINNITLCLSGALNKEAKGWMIDIKSDTLVGNVSDFLDLLPESVLNGRSGYDTSGDFKMFGWVKGIVGEDQSPHFEFACNLSNGSITNKSDNEGIKDLNLDLLVRNKSNQIDSMHVLVDQLRFNLYGDPFYASINAKNPENWYLDGKVDGTLNFDKIEKFFGKKQSNYKGELIVDAQFNGFYNDILNEKYDQFKADGSVIVNNLEIYIPKSREPVSIKSGKFIVSPQSIELKQVQTTLYGSSLTLGGEFRNYIPFFMENQLLEGDFTISTPELNINQVLRFANHQSQRGISQTAASSKSKTKILTVPTNVDVSIVTDIKRLILEKEVVNGVRGKINIKEGVAELDKLSLGMFGGTIVLNGDYRINKQGLPHIELETTASSLDLKALYNNMTFVKKALPVIADCQGRISTRLDFRAHLDSTMQLIPSTLYGNGLLQANHVVLNGSKAVESLSNVVNSEELKRVTISSLNMKFDVSKGDLVIKPFTTKVAGNTLTMSGTQTLAGVLDYDMTLDVQRRYFGSEVEKLLRSLPGGNNINELTVDVTITGTTKDPVITPNISKAIQQVTKSALEEFQKKSGKDIMNSLKRLFR